MTDIRTRLADLFWDGMIIADADRFIDALLSLPGIAIMELPEPYGYEGELARWETPGGDVEAGDREVLWHTHIYRPPDQAREVAAADAAEEKKASNGNT
jgi:hypothetical protein